MSKLDYLQIFKYNLLMEDLSHNTANQYYKCVRRILINLPWSLPEEISQRDVISGLVEIDNPSEVSGVRNGFRYFCKYFPTCTIKNLPMASSIGKSAKPIMAVSKRELKSLLNDAFIKGSRIDTSISSEIVQQEFQKYYALLDIKYKRQK